MKGTYLLEASLKKPVNISVGSLGVIPFAKGFYYYSGSAQNSLEKRLERHYKKTPDKKLFWHIDYLLEKAEPISHKTFPYKKQGECLTTKKLLKLGSEPVKGFGASDCKCFTHLVYSKKRLKLIQ